MRISAKLSDFTLVHFFPLPPLLNHLTGSCWPLELPRGTVSQPASQHKQTEIIPTNEFFARLSDTTSFSVLATFTFFFLQTHRLVHFSSSFARVTVLKPELTIQLARGKLPETSRGRNRHRRQKGGKNLFSREKLVLPASDRSTFARIDLAIVNCLLFSAPLPEKSVFRREMSLLWVGPVFFHAVTGLTSGIKAKIYILVVVWGDSVWD